jgi:protein FAM32A
MAPNEYSTVGSGKLKLKGVKDSKIDKKKKKKEKSSSSKHKEGEESAATEATGDEFKDRSVMLKNLEEEDEAMANEEGRSLAKQRGEKRADSDAGQRQEELGEVVKTEAERRYEEQRRKRVCLIPTSPIFILAFVALRSCGHFTNGSRLTTSCTARGTTETRRGQDAQGASGGAQQVPQLPERTSRHAENRARIT